MTTLLTGGTGFVGKNLIKRLQGVTVVSRSPETAQLRLHEAGFAERLDDVIEWNNGLDPKDLARIPPINSVINLMGESIAEGRWTKTKKTRIRSSRVDGTRSLVNSIIEAGHLPKVFISASAIGLYGDTGETVVEEDSPAGRGFLPEVCQEWESATAPLEALGVRVVHLRIGIVLGPNGGALKKLVPLFRTGLGGPLGNGKQWMAWIHVLDLVSMIQWLMETQVSGGVNATAPNPVRNLEFTKSLASTLGRPAFLPAPQFAVRLALGEFANSLFISSRIVPGVALSHGFQFQFGDIQSALQNAINS
ncbi:TIGR01777 family oxidoreductase [Mariniblastus sp.]|nr:TIGR01777 family oxidoreductase [Mariniblastus sp.]MDB4357050.1 TIGR01777 family oxidoreductase [Mariniblastus sp.]